MMGTAVACNKSTTAAASPPPLHTTYSNDNSGLSQVLVSDDGTTQIHNLFGLTLFHQDDGTTTRTLLADGLGSVRVEMVGSAVDNATTYEPYGKLLACNRGYYDCLTRFIF